MTKDSIFSTRHYDRTAKILRPHILLHAEIMALVVADFLEAFEDDNPRFDQKAFLEACGL